MAACLPFTCTFKPHFISLSPDLILLIDVDECAMGVHTCDQICNVSTDGWYNCSCRDGFTLDQDEHTCNGVCQGVRWGHYKPVLV